MARRVVKIHRLTLACADLLNVVEQSRTISQILGDYTGTLLLGSIGAYNNLSRCTRN